MANTVMIACIVGVWVLAFAGSSNALHCNGDIITIDTGVAILYLDDRSDEVGEINHWMYLETNGRTGLQSGGDNNILDDCGAHIPCLPVDPCRHHDPDQLIL